MLFTLTIGTYSVAPADVFATTSVTATALLFGIITPWHPAHSALLIKAPKLCGSSISSAISMKGA